MECILTKYIVTFYSSKKKPSLLTQETTIDTIILASSYLVVMDFSSYSPLSSQTHILKLSNRHVCKENYKEGILFMSNSVVWVENNLIARARDPWEESCGEALEKKPKRMHGICYIPLLPIQYTKLACNT